MRLGSLDRRRVALAVVAIIAAVALWWVLNLGARLVGGVTFDPVKRDFLVDQQKFADANAAQDAKIADGYVTGHAHSDLAGSFLGGTLLGAGGHEDIRPTSIDVEHTTDPNDPTLDLDVHEQGFVTFEGQSLLGGTRTDVRRFDNRYWMSQEGGRYEIADVAQNLSATSWSDELLGSGGWWRLLLAIVAVGLASVRIVRRLPVPKPKPEPTYAPVAPAGLELRDAAALGKEPDGRVRIQTFGGLHIWVGEDDLAAELLSRKVSGFMFLYLMARAIVDPLSQLMRAALGEEMFPRIGQKDQRKRVRDHLSDISKELPAPLIAAVRGGDPVSLDISSLDIDAVSLLQLAKLVEGGEALTGAGLGQAQTLVAASAGQFLPMWDELQDMTEGRDAIREFIEDLRTRLANARITLMLAIGAARLQVGEAAAAVAPLKEANDLRGDREDIARLLARAYRLSGQDARASELERTYGLS